MNERDRGDLLRTERKEIIKKQKGVRSRNRTYVKNNFLVLTNTYVTRETRNY